MKPIYSTNVFLKNNNPPPKKKFFFLGGGCYFFLKHLPGTSNWGEPQGDTKWGTPSIYSEGAHGFVREEKSYTLIGQDLLNKEYDLSKISMSHSLY